MFLLKFENMFHVYFIRKSMFLTSIIITGAEIILTATGVS